MARNVFACVAISMLVYGTVRAIQRRGYSSLVVGVVSAIAAIGSGVAYAKLAADSAPSRASTASTERIVTDSRFRSADGPELEVRAPKGWRISFDEKKGTVMVRADGDPPDAFLALSTFASDPLLLAEYAAEALKAMKGTAECEASSASPKVAALDTAAIDCRNAVSRWRLLIIRRRRGVFTTLQCGTPLQGTPDSACDRVLDSVAWIEPAAN